MSKSLENVAIITRCRKRVRLLLIFGVSIIAVLIRGYVSITPGLRATEKIGNSDNELDNYLQHRRAVVALYLRVAFGRSGIYFSHNELLGNERYCSCTADHPLGFNLSRWMRREHPRKRAYPRTRARVRRARG